MVSIILILGGNYEKQCPIKVVIRFKDRYSLGQDLSVPAHHSDVSGGITDL